MAMNALRKHIAIAIDGGGIRGLIVSQALQVLEEAMGGEPLIHHPQIKILAGTSTGAVIGTGIAIGMHMKDITQIYLDLGRTVFPPLFPAWVPASLQDMLKLLLGVFKPALYPNRTLKDILCSHIDRLTGDPNLTLGALQKRLKSDQALVITAANINERRTHFLKSNDGKDAHWELWAAALASAAAPTVLPVIPYDGAFFTDGGVGSFGNPGAVAAREAVEWRGYAPGDVSVISIGTGWSSAATFEAAHGRPDTWKNVDWAMNAVQIMLGDAARSQSVDVIHDFVAQGMDFRRFQIELNPDIDMADTRDATMARMQQLGVELGQRILQNQYASEDHPEFDPEGIFAAVERYEASLARSRRQSAAPNAPIIGIIPNGQLRR
ncbi:MAG: patatin-like phospholipase family protein [Anaerolineae bacterium]|nr:patatin-like phospholipase family protein [Anaerolineae bacterium]NUQ06584.1 patatin-like phospholipase family protein [Anaerolineae bacterium]